MKRKYITVDDAIKLLPDGEYVHTFHQMGMALIGADWDKEDVIAKLKSVDYIELTGKEARNMGHGIAVYNKDTKWQSDVLFIETDKDKIDAFDPLEEQRMKMEMTIDESIRILVDRYIDTYVVCGGENYNPAINITRQDCEAFHVAVDAMRKYQKMLEAFDKIREQIKSNLRGVEIALEVLNENHPLRPKMEGAKDTLEECLELIDKAETEAE